jgi:hypothetical protein
MRIVLYFITSIILFNWFSRLSLTFINALFDLGTAITTVVNFVILITTNNFADIKSWLGLGGCCCLIAFSVVIYFYFHIDPIDKGILINE